MISNPLIIPQYYLRWHTIVILGPMFHAGTGLGDAQMLMQNEDHTRRGHTIRSRSQVIKLGITLVTGRQEIMLLQARVIKNLYTSSESHMGINIPRFRWCSGINKGHATNKIVDDKIWNQIARIIDGSVFVLGPWLSYWPCTWAISQLDTVWNTGFCRNIIGNGLIPVGLGFRRNITWFGFCRNIIGKCSSESPCSFFMVLINSICRSCIL